MVQKVQKAVKHKLEEQATSNGQFSAAKLSEFLAQHTENISKILDNKLETLKLSPGSVEEANESQEHEEQNTIQLAYFDECWNSRNIMYLGHLAHLHSYSMVMSSYQ